MRKVIIMSPNKCKAKGKCPCKIKSLRERFIRFEQQLRTLYERNEIKRRETVKRADYCLIQLICEIIINILKGNIQLPESQYVLLKQHKRSMLKLCARDISLAEKKNILSKIIAEGFLQKVLPGIVQVIID